MLVFLKKVTLFLLPVALIFTLPLIVIFVGKEYVSIDEVVKTQQQFSGALFGFSYADTFLMPYKKAIVKTKNPAILVLGTSRVMQIRKEFFATPPMHNFVNTGGATRQLKDMEIFIQDLPEDSDVRIILLGLDQEVLYGENYGEKMENETSLPVRIVDTISLMSRRMYLDYFAHKYSLTQLFTVSQTRNNIGLSALVNGDGFREDGSYAYFQAEHTPRLHEIVQMKVKAKTNEITQVSRDVSVYNSQQLEMNLSLLNRILEVCKKRNITVIGFTPPYPPEIYNAMIQTNGLYHDMLVVGPKKASEVFRVQDFSFFDFSSISIFGGKDTEFVDEVHGTDVMYLKMMIYMAEHAKEMTPYLDVVSLKKMLQNTHGDFLSF